jgi:hypothetical protein
MSVANPNAPPPHSSQRRPGAAAVLGQNSSHDDSDLLGVAIPLPYRHVLYPYGFPVHIKSNDQDVIRAAELSWGSFEERFRAEPIELRIVVTECVSRRQPRPPTHRAQATLLTLISDANNFGCCDLSKGYGFAYLTRAAVTHTDFLQHNFLEGMAYTLLDTQHLASLHAACIGRNGCGVLLAGESGNGKSSLAYACVRRGWTYIADEVCSLVLRRKGRTVVGNPHAFRFRPSISDIFPELQGHVRQRNGKPTLEIPIERFPGFETAHECEASYVVFLDRQTSSGEVCALLPIARVERFRRLFRNRWPSELSVHEDRMAAIEKLADLPAFELTYESIDSAIDILERLVDESSS